MKLDKEREPARQGNESMPQKAENANTVSYYKVMTQLIESITRILPQAKIIYAAASDEGKYATIDFKLQTDGERDISVKVEVNNETD